MCLPHIRLSDSSTKDPQIHDEQRHKGNCDIRLPAKAALGVVCGRDPLAGVIIGHPSQHLRVILYQPPLLCPQQSPNGLYLNKSHTTQFKYLCHTLQQNKHTNSKILTQANTGDASLLQVQPWTIVQYKQQKYAAKINIFGTVHIAAAIIIPLLLHCQPLLVSVQLAMCDILLIRYSHQHYG
jgi:hypothetical protein